MGTNTCIYTYAGADWKELTGVGCESQPNISPGYK